MPSSTLLDYVWQKLDGRLSNNVTAHSKILGTLTWRATHII